MTRPNLVVATGVLILACASSVATAEMVIDVGIHRFGAGKANQTIILRVEEDPGSDPWNEFRPPEHLYHLTTDYACLNNLADDDEHAEHKQRLIREMEKLLTQQHDARMLGYGDMYESFPRYGPFKPELKGFDRRGEYNPDYLIEIPDEVFVSELYHKALKAKLEDQ